MKRYITNIQFLKKLVMFVICTKIKKLLKCYNSIKYI